MWDSNCIRNISPSNIIIVEPPLKQGIGTNKITSAERKILQGQPMQALSVGMEWGEKEKKKRREKNNQKSHSQPFFKSVYCLHFVKRENDYVAEVYFMPQAYFFHLFIDKE